MILSQSTDRTSSHSASFYLLFLTLGILTTKGIKKIIIIIILSRFLMRSIYFKDLIKQIQFYYY